MKVVEGVIRSVVEQYAIVSLDDNGHIIDYDIIEEKDAYDVELVEVLKEIKDEEIPDHREVE
jgi:hypothetical protein